MPEPRDVIKDADNTVIENDGHRRFKESVETSRTPQQERDEAANSLKKPVGYGTTK
jgi:hypothetical protein